SGRRGRGPRGRRRHGSGSTRGRVRRGPARRRHPPSRCRRCRRGEGRRRGSRGSRPRLIAVGMTGEKARQVRAFLFSEHLPLLPPVETPPPAPPPLVETPPPAPSPLAGEGWDGGSPQATTHQLHRHDPPPPPTLPRTRGREPVAAPAAA